MTEPQCQYNKQFTDFIVKMCTNLHNQTLGNTQFNDFNFEDNYYVFTQTAVNTEFLILF